MSAEQIAAGLTKALDAIESVSIANAANFNREGKEWEGYNQACFDCHAAVRRILQETTDAQ